MDNLFKNDVYKKQGNKIEYNGKVYWLPNELFEKLKVIAKNKKIGMLDFAISLKEFLNEDIIDELDFTINWESISNLKNKNEDIYILCSNNTKRYYGKPIQKLMEKLKWEGINKNTKMAVRVPPTATAKKAAFFLKLFTNK